MSETQNSQSNMRGDGFEGGEPARHINPQHWVWGYLPAGIGFLFWIGSVLPQSFRFSSGSYLGLMWWIPVAVVLHELGHFIAGQLLGLKSWLFTIGYGEVVFQRQFKGFTLILRAIPYSGAVYPFITEPQTNWARWRLFAMVLAGPLINVILCAVFTKLALDPTRELSLFQVPEQIAVANAYLLCWSLIPFSSNIDGFATPNDALLLIQLVRGQKADTSNPPPGAGPGSGIPKGPSWSWIVGHADANAILSRCREQLGDPYRPLEERHQVLDTFATSVLMFGAREFLEEADRYSEELYTAKPAELTVKGTRGSVLIELGRIEEGVSMLHEVIANDPSAFDRAISASFLALAEFKRGNQEAAVDWLRQSRELDPHCGSLKRIERLITSKPV